MKAALVLLALSAPHNYTPVPGKVQYRPQTCTTYCYPGQCYPALNICDPQRCTTTCY